MTIDERYFKDNENQAQNIEDVLMDNEKILWKAKPRKVSVGTLLADGFTPSAVSFCLIIGLPRL